jgi:hypothetical protein
MNTTRILDLIGGVCMVVGFAYLSGGWKNYWRRMNLPFGEMLTQAHSEDRPLWARAVFWLGVGLLSLAAWRQWSGV